MIKLRQARALLISGLWLVGGLMSACSTQSDITPVTLTPIPAATQTTPAEPTVTSATPATNASGPTVTGTSTLTDTNTDTSSPTISQTGSGEQPSGLPDTGMAVVEQVEIRILESFPIQVQAVATGYLPDGCTTITGAEAVREGAQFRLHITTERPVDAICTLAITKFEQVIPLDIADLPAGSYQVVVNDLSVAFELPAGQTGALPSETGSYPVVETPTTFVLAQVDVPIYAAPAAGGSEIGLIAGGQVAKVTGASPDGAWWRVICPDDSVGDCWVSADPAMTTPTSPQ